jgi:hypothetical protein
MIYAQHTAANNAVKSRILCGTSRDKTYILTPWSRALLENLTGSQVVKMFSALYETRKFFTAFTSDRHLSLSQTDPLRAPHISLPKDPS